MPELAAVSVVVEPVAPDVLAVVSVAVPDPVVPEVAAVSVDVAEDPVVAALLVLLPCGPQTVAELAFVAPDVVASCAIAGKLNASAMTAVDENSFFMLCILCFSKWDRISESIGSLGPRILNVAPAGSFRKNVERAKLLSPSSAAFP